MQWGGSGATLGAGGICNEYVRVISKMIYDEPCVFGLISMLQSFCLRHGMHIRWGNTPPTPSFQEHIQKHYVPFCR